MGMTGNETRKQELPVRMNALRPTGDATRFDFDDPIVTNANRRVRQQGQTVILIR
jgi:hypothetical protein